ncbi:hypothetical protein HZS_4158 [Henneguya salminicola]|nr:hypothetical protein HZS_4158 [Henneguya salminicola]
MYYKMKLIDKIYKCIKRYIAKCWERAHYSHEADSSHNIKFYLEYNAERARYNCIVCVAPHLMFKDACELIFKSFNRRQEDYLLNL